MRLNSVWVTAAHVLVFDQYIAHHAKEAEMMTRMPISPRIMMAVTGPIVGLISGLVLGLFAFVAARIMRARVTT
jgi:uncharacterized membrane protein